MSVKARTKRKAWVVYDDAPTGFIQALCDKLTMFGYATENFEYGDGVALLERLLAWHDLKRKPALRVIYVGPASQFDLLHGAVENFLNDEEKEKIRLHWIDPKEVDRAIEALVGGNDIYLTKLLFKEHTPLTGTFETICWEGDYGIATTGLFYAGNGSAKKFANFTIEGMRVLRVLLGGGRQEDFYELSVSKGDRRGELLIPVERVEEAHKNLPYFCDFTTGRGYASKFANLLRAFASRKEPEIVCGTLGWHKIRERWAFVWSNSPIYMPLSESSLVSRYEHVEPCTPEEALEVVESFLSCHTRRATSVLLAGIALAPLKRFIAKIRPVDFALYINGLTACGKSTLARLALCFFGKSWGHSALPDWSGTKNGLVAALAEARDLPVVVDDLHPATGTRQRRELEEKVAVVLRSYTSGSGRLRATVGGRLRPTQPIESFLIFNGETELPPVQSLRNRTFVVKLHRRDFDLGLVRRLVKGAGRLNATGCLYTRRLEEVLNENEQAFVETIRAHLEKADELTSLIGDARLANAASALLVAVEVFGELVLGNAGKSLVESVKGDILDAAVAQVERSQQASMVARFLRAVEDLVEEGRVKLWDASNIDTLFSGWIIWASKGNLYIPAGLLKETQRWLSMHGEAPLDEGLLIAELESLHPALQKQPRKDPRGKKVRVLVVPMEVVREAAPWLVNKEEAPILGGKNA